jgi:cytochrome P450 family 135
MTPAPEIRVPTTCSVPGRAETRAPTARSVPARTGTRLPRARSTTLPPGPLMPKALQSMVWFRHAQWLLAQCAARFGDMFTLRIFHEGTWVVLSHPDHIKQVFTGDPRVFHAGEGNRILLPVLGRHSVLLLDEESHMEQRKLLLPPFHGKRMERYGELMARIAGEEIEQWPLGEPYRLRPRMQAVTLEIILRAVFGVDEGERLVRLRSELRRLLNMVTSPATLVFPILLGPERLARFGPLQRDVGRIDSLIYQEIAARRRAGGLEDRQDILSLLLEARHEDGRPMDDRELRDELVTLLVAGHETTANALAWAVERLVRHPDKLARLTAEIAAGESQYLEAVVIETLRLRPVLSLVARRLTEPVEIGGWTLPAGVTVTPSIYLIHRRPDIYPDPDQFRPERFLDNPPGTYTWIPFGGGIRRCLGAAFAQFEMGVVLSELVRRRGLSPVRPASERVFRRAITETPRRDAEVMLT